MIIVAIGMVRDIIVLTAGGRTAATAAIIGVAIIAVGTRLVTTTTAITTIAATIATDHTGRHNNMSTFGAICPMSHFAPSVSRAAT
ncbi:hypothetical protein [Rhizobium sp. BR 314]|uniref:hypothetical protein n=1 Tax=Rhizobium sp. BR 314 TaxID=3040013 RepID=UPI0039BF86A3